jgi:predicted TIM-barrel fold metal-dependent hydrolase
MPPILTTSADPNTRTPTFKCPPGTVDTHIHLFGPAEQYTWDPNTYYTARDATPEMNIALQDRLGFSNSVIVSGGAYGRNYTHLSDTLTRFPHRFRGVALIPDDLGDAEFARLTGLGVRGMRLFSASRGGVLPTISEPIAAKAHAHGWHVQFYPHGADITEFADRLLALPNTIVLDHFASVKAELGLEQPGFRTLKRMLDSGKVWIKLSGPMRCAPGDFPYAAVTPMARALVRHRPDRLVFGTDWPHVNMDGRNVPNDGDLVDLIPEWIEDAAAQRQILVDNPRRLYGFPAAA